MPVLGVKFDPAGLTQWVQPSTPESRLGSVLENGHVRLTPGVLARTPVVKTQRL